MRVSAGLVSQGRAYLHVRVDRPSPRAAMRTTWAGFSPPWKRSSTTARSGPAVSTRQVNPGRGVVGRRRPNVVPGATFRVLVGYTPPAGTGLAGGGGAGGGRSSGPTQIQPSSRSSTG